MKKTLFVFLSLLLLVQCKKQNLEKETLYQGTIAKDAIVVSARKEASKIGLQILKDGGNAFDAMIATEFALAVAYPFAGNIGGGGFMVYRTNNGEIGALDYREKAPLAASKDMYLDSNGSIIKGKSTLGSLSIGVPGTVAGMFEVHKQFGSIPMEQIIQPVIELATTGIIVTKKQEDRLAKSLPLFKKVNKDSILFFNDWKENDSIKYLNLAKTFSAIQKNGKSEFYEGETAKKLVSFVQDNGGIITLEDLKKYKAIWREPIVFKYDNLKIISMSPPSSGGICLAQIMNSIEPFEIDKYGHNSSKYIQIITEASRRAYADRSYFLGDPDFVQIPLDKLISKSYSSQRMESFSFENATSSTNLSHGDIQIYESDETTHYSIIDQFGNSISATTTLNGAYGSKLFSNELGFFLNNEMDDFSSKPGKPNMFGLIGAEANSILPEKRMLSSMTPTIVEKDNKLFMSVGTPGGSTIITTVLQTILNVHEYKFGIQQAIDQPRFHHQWLPDVIKMEPNKFDSLTKIQLKQKGYFLDEKNSPIIGKVNGILVLKNGFLEGGADKRGDDSALGF